MRDISRRTALEALTYVAGFLVVGRARLSAQPAPLVRRDVTQLSNEEQARFKEAVKALKSKMIGGESAWIINADTHRIYCSRDAKEVHGTWWFLPWHRAYLHATERNLQKALGDDRVALPYWHWSISPGIPALYKTGSLDHPRTGQDVAFPPYLLDLTGMAAPSYRGRVVDGQVIESAFGGHSGTRFALVYRGDTPRVRSQCCRWRHDAAGSGGA